MLHLLLPLLLLQLLLLQKQRSNLLFEERKSRVSGFFFDPFSMSRGVIKTMVI
jgi:hypothetical protein